MSDWTREPWPEWDQAHEMFVTHGCVGEVVFAGVRKSDFDRARACVAALAGRVPDKLAALEEAVELAMLHREDLRQALAAFRGETHE